MEPKCPKCGNSLQNVAPADQPDSKRCATCKTVWKLPWLTLVPAYGRDYKSDLEILEDWNKRRDFQIADVSCRWKRCYIGIGEAENYSALYGCTFKIRFNKLADFCLIRFIDGKWTSLQEA